MTLRTRLVLAVVIIVAGLVAVLGYVALRQRSVLTEQLDDQLAAVEPRIADDLSTFDTRSQSTGRDGTPPLGELYLAIVEGDTKQVMAQPASQPDLDPAITSAELAERAEPGQPFTIDTETDGKARAVAIPLDDDRWVLAALSTDAVDDAQQQLLITAAGALAVLAVALGLVLWWVDRLGIRPITAVTHAAEEVAEGRSDRRVQYQGNTTEAGRLGAAFNAMLDASQEAEARQRRFVADASHELRTPLTTLQGYTILHASGGHTTPEQTDDAMRRINTEANRMAVLVDDLLTLAAFDESRPLDPTSLNLTQLLHDIATDAHAIQPTRSIHTTEISEDLILQADIHQLTQALTTIVLNALHHTPTTANLTLRAAINNQTIRIDVIDNGPGIPDQHLDRLFDRFYRADPSRSSTKGGSGLGLAIAKAIIDAHEGTITAHSNIGIGTKITIDLPTQTTQDPTEPLFAAGC